MEWRVTVELSGADGTKQTHEVARGGHSDPHSLLDSLALTLDDGKTLPASVQRHSVQARVGVEGPSVRKGVPVPNVLKVTLRELGDFNDLRDRLWERLEPGGMWRASI